MSNFLLYNLNDYSLFEDILLNELKFKNLVILCIGTKNYENDAFGVKIGDELKNVKIISLGHSKREINGLNYSKVYDFIKQKLPEYKVVILDSVYINGDSKPYLVFKKSGVNVSGINSDKVIGDYGILYNSFSYSSKNIKDFVINLLTKTFNKLCQNN